MNAPVRCPSQQDFPSHGLWSLWDMFRVYAHEYIALGESIHDLRVLFYRKDTPWTEDEKQSVSDQLKRLLEHAKNLDLLVSAETISQRLDRAEPITSLDAYDLLIDVTRSELRSKLFIYIDPREQKWFEPDQPIFGEDFANKFKTYGVFELDETGKCLALGRSTAAVFHLMRLMELGIRALARSLAIPDPIKPAERNWAIILKSIWSGIEKKWPTTADRSSGDGVLFVELYASLDAVKNPWRNPTMHVENKYTGEEAEHILVVVRGFMKKLASRMDEQGMPLA